MSKMNPSKEMTLEEAAERFKSLIKHYGKKKDCDLVIYMYAVAHRRDGAAPHLLATGSWDEPRRADNIITLHQDPDAPSGPVKMEIVKDRDHWGNVDDIAPLEVDFNRSFVDPNDKT